MWQLIGTLDVGTEPLDSLLTVETLNALTSKNHTALLLKHSKQVGNNMRNTK